MNQAPNWKMGLFSRGKGGLGGLGSTDTLIDEQLETQHQEDLESGDHERFSHYVKKDKIVESAVSGKPVTALCGKRWVPSRDPKKFPICPTCKEIHAGLRKGPDDNGGSDNGGNHNSPA
jgi:hypothetical protein